MRKVSKSDIFSTGLAIFSMLFGGGNLMYPIEVGMQSGTNLIYGLCGFILTGVILPLVGLVGMLLFDGNIDSFFNRLGKQVGQLLLFACILIIGPLIAIPRIVTLSHTMMRPFLPFAFLQEQTYLAAAIFALIFLGITFLATVRESKIISILGNIISPALLVSLIIIIIKGIMTAEISMPSNMPALQLFNASFMVGYKTLDLLGAIFFASIILTVLKTNLGNHISENKKFLARISFQSGIIGVSLLALIYIGLGILGAYHGHNFMTIYPDILFREIAFKIMGSYGAALIGVSVLMACLSTAIAISAVVAEFVQKKIFKHTIPFANALLLVMASCLPLSIAGFSTILGITAGPILYIGYPVLITLTICNILFKLYDFKPVKIPVLITFLSALASYFSHYFV